MPAAMRLAIISDTHLPRDGRTIPEACLERCREADVILHAGDVVDIPALDALRSLGPPLHAVCGNVDSAAVRALLPTTLELELGGARIGMIHIPGAAAGRLKRLRGEFPACDAVVFGHTHMPEHAELDGFQIFNPGSPTERRRAPMRSMGLATVTDARVVFELLALGA